MSQSASSTSRAWSVVIAALGINLVLGSLYAWPIIGKALVGQWHWSKTDAALPFSISTAAFAFTMIFAGRLQDKVGPKLVALLGGLAFGAGMFVSSWAHTPSVMALTFGVLGGMGIGLCYSATTPPAVKWFSPGRKGLIMGIVVAGVGLAPVYVAPLTTALLKLTNDTAISIPNTFAYLGVGAIAAISILSLILTNPPAGYTPVPMASSGASRSKGPVSHSRDVSPSQMLKTRQFYQLWFMLLLGASAGLMIIAHLGTIAKEQAKFDTSAYIAVALLAIFNTLGRIISGGVSDRLGRTQTLILAFVLQAANMFVFVHYTSATMLLFGACFTGLCYGTIFPLMPAAIADYYGVKNLGMNYGLLFTAFGIAGVCGPIVGGMVRDAYGSFSLSYIITGAMLLAGAALAFATRPPKVAVEPVPEVAQSVR